MAGACRDPHSVAERLAVWADEARTAGRVERADALLLLAWRAYDMPPAQQRPTMMTEQVTTHFDPCISIPQQETGAGRLAATG